VAFSASEVEERARQRIAIDLGCDPEDVEVTVERPPFYEERRSHYRN
jgi:hypothetical protein